MTLTWNLVAKSMTPHEQLQRKMRQKIAKLERHLQKFPPDAVHLQVSLDRQRNRELFRVRLTLRVPSNILHSEKSAADPIPALDHAVKALLKELASLKADLRHEKPWKQRGRRARLHASKALRFSDQPLGHGGGETLVDAVAAFLQGHHEALLAHIRRRLSRDEAAGDLPARAIDPQAVVDEVARRALQDPGSKPPQMSYRLWLYDLARRDLRRRYRDLREAARQNVSLDEPAEVPAGAEPEGHDATKPLEIIARQLEPPMIHPEQGLADAYALSPEEELEHKDFIEYLQRMAAEWPKKEHDVFELHFMEGFDTDEVAMLERIKPAETEELIASVQERIRQAMTAAAGLGATHHRVGSSMNR